MNAKIKRFVITGTLALLALAGMAGAAVTMAANTGGNKAQATYYQNCSNALMHTGVVAGKC